ncbi:amino acid adenylation domain-containing protein [Frankia sp. AgB32]|uniref:amino acid adenylation domain-containing protein n=1 Tax=Frankia sp. AgB32 TaxID=631119 RepID=UPI00200FA2BA|nr:amino acid adenylation domain-containing protein [Frankia sp. AgB32]MCK9897080.1 amino acid adenylation domain-containing protein [Frankia sp. AgB32]
MTVLHDYLRQGAARRPDAPAVAGPDGRLTYGELDRAADALAADLRAVGVGRGDRVVIWSHKTTRVIAAFQAVLRLGAVYVPLDEQTPAERAALVARDCGARAVATTPERSALLRDRLAPTCPTLDLRARAADGAAPATAPESDQTGPDDLAYILYTSGSTGVPKGVSIRHRDARAFVDWAAEVLSAGPDDRFANHAPLTFDLSVLDIYAAFAVGASVHLVPAELAFSPTQLTEFIRGSAITVWYSVPSAIMLMMRAGGLLTRVPPPALRAVLFAGEPFPIAPLRELAAWTPARLLNLYGPTETNVCTFHEVRADDLARDVPVPIGRAASGDRVWAESPDGGVVRPGEEGELVVEGPTVMAGYWGRPSHEGPYRTGDIVRLRPDGGFDYVGRRDHMVKIRGHRIELGEVEAALAAHPGIYQAAVVAGGQGAEAQLLAFAVPRAGHDPGPLELRGHIAARLPRYMIPDEIHLVESLPRNDNGKVDRRRLARERPVAAVAGPARPAAAGREATP